MYVLICLFVEKSFVEIHMLFQGDVTATDDGSFILIFDNTHSMFRKKQLYYKLSVPTEAEQPQVTEADVEAE